MQSRTEDLEAIRRIAQEMVRSASFAGMDHVERVARIAEQIGCEEGADLDVLRAAAYLHDIAVPLDKLRHYDLGGRLARGLLRDLGWTEEQIEPVVHAVEAHSRYGGPEPQTLEARILQDADAVEYVGAVGLARAIVRSYEAGEYRGNVAELAALVDRLIERVEGSLHTARGRELAADRISWLRLFQERLQAELAGEM
ncbi:MAG: HD domain-containing protein [Anaerolineae bacterium]